jgi:hypothetical protein
MNATKLAFAFMILLVSCKSGKNWTCVEGNCDNGYGKKLWKDGGFEKGNWKNGKLEGEGVQFFGKTSDFAGDTYEGEFKDDKYNGKGTYHDVSNGATHVGYWKDDQPNGKGIVRFDENSKWPGEYYEGDWKNGKREGFGIRVYSSKKGNKGGTYIGEWKNDKKEGKGKYIYLSGSSYEGDWVNDVEQGYGIHKDTNGKTARVFCQDGNCQPIKDK